MTALFGGALFWSAWVLFCIEPLVGKMLLPLLGGVPAVWNACLVFFQGALLAGYLFAHGTLRWLGPRRQIVAQIVLVGGAFLALPIAIDEGAIARFASLGPSGQALAVLVARVALPFFALSTVAPTLQRWFSTTPSPRAHDPYFLYAASNLGSFGALLAYPTVVEPWMGLRVQASAMRWSYAALAVLVAVCGVGTWRAGATSSSATRPPTPDAAAPIAWTRRARWIFLAFVPSAYLVAVTEHVTTDVSPTPLLWTVPLAAYLLSFVLVFGTRAAAVREVTARAFPVVALAVAYVIASATRTPVQLVLPLHLVAFLLASLACHGELASDRPEPARLPEFYVWMSAGGFLGGVVVGLVAPAVLSRALEYPACVVLALAARRASDGAKTDRRKDALIAIAVLATVALVGIAARRGAWPIAPVLTLTPALPLVVAWASRAKSARFATVVGAGLCGALALPDPLGVVLSRDRNFFGTLTVSHDRRDRWVQITHGTTIHGMQAIEPGGRREPRTYYARSGPIGDVLSSFAASGPPAARVAIVGLGAGTLAAYAKPDQEWTFFEINPAVIRVAEDPSRFTYLSDAFPGGARLSVIEGDARLELARAGGRWDLLVIDAFSSDAIPVHLVTEEAMRLYVSKVDPRAMIAWHVTNRSLDLRPVLAELAHAVGWTAWLRRDFELGEADAEAGKAGSMWAAMAADEATLEPLRARGWEPLARRPAFASWTDERSSVLSILTASRR